MAIQTEDRSQVKERWQILHVPFTPKSVLFVLCFSHSFVCVFVNRDLSFSIYCFHLDPHVKVEGKRANVLEAKRKILEVLETRVRLLVLHIYNVKNP